MMRRIGILGTVAIGWTLLLPPPGPAVPPSLQQPPRSKTLHASVEDRVFEIVNFERISRGLPPLEREPTLVEIARDHSMDMLEREFFAHENPDGDGPGARVAARHRRLIGTTAENIWTSLRGPVDEAILAGDIMRGLMNSPGHRENILREELTHLGIGVYSAPGSDVLSTEIMATQLFGSVRAYTREPIPDSLGWGTVMNFRLNRFGDEGGEPTFFDIWSEADQRIVHGPAPLQRARINAPAGRYRLRFYFREGRRFAFAIFPGPRIIVD